MSFHERYRTVGLWIKIVAILLPLVIYLGTSYALVCTRSRPRWNRNVAGPEEVGSAR